MSDPEREQVARQVEDTLNAVLDDLLEPIAAQHAAARKKYRPLVRGLKDVEFAGLWEVVVEERQVRLERLSRMLRR